ncbi:hypothetical protein CY34DRAFT_491810 [Suillus luteus UH-Slu-Lm8-n1]|uniref:Uncharacterized protein n=1 Tax=Suillus luteus UH-Slu-Lm8-n1 TaxID=930992 RepID=A0A0C9ZHC5_9AGAM|nr:hypothetical protein CY34DRAFT_491810 [Suillus luteus UH-Slu-Lm8-n1]
MRTQVLCLWQQSVSLLQFSPSVWHAPTDIMDVVSATMTVREEKRIMVGCSRGDVDSRKMRGLLLYMLARNYA